MSRKSGRTTSRNRVETYKGFDIIKVTVTSYYKPHYSLYYTDIVNKREVHYDFCKEGESNRPSQAYSCYANTIAECKECIDKFIEDDSLYFTEEERYKYVYKPNSKCHWAYGYDSLMKLLKAHQKADKRMRVLIVDRLDDANFHYEAGMLSEGRYEELTDFIKQTYLFREKFEVITETQAKRIKDPKQFIEGLQQVITEYLNQHGANNTIAKVKFIENW